MGQERGEFDQASADRDEILAAHRRWVDSAGREGAQAVLRGMSFERSNLSGAMLRGADLENARFRDAVLAGADLAGADLSGVDFQGSDLSRADLRGAKLRDAVFRDTNLNSADLSDSVGLLGGNLGGADLTGAKLPEAVGKFEGLNNVAEASKTTQGLFASLLLVCSYIWLTVASTTDAQLMNNAAPPSSRLPILGTDIPLVRFYSVAPCLLLCLYVYFHLCLQRLWEELADLPAVFPDGRPLDKKTYPWLMNVLVRSHVPRLRGGRSHLSRWQAGMSIVLAWGLVPMTLLILWVRYLRGHDWYVTGLHVALIAAAIGVGTGFMHLAGTTLRGSERRPFLWIRAWSDARARCFGAALAGMAAFAMLSYGAIEGVNPLASERGIEVHKHAGPWSPRRVVPLLFAAAGLDVFAHLDDAALSIKPPGWAGETLREMEAVKGADLTGRNLRFAWAYNSFLVNADMMGLDARGTDFRESDLRVADLRGADLRAANFRAANLARADLRGTDLSETNLREANLRDAKMLNAILKDAQLRDAKASGADLQGADLTGANLSGTDLRGANLTGVVGLTQEQLNLATIDASTKLSPEFVVASKFAKRTAD